MRIRRRLSVVSVTAAVVLTTVGSAAAAGGTTSRVSVSSTGAQAKPVQDPTDIAQVELDVPTAPAVSADGRYVVFTSDAANLVPGDTNDTPDVFVRDRRAGTTTRVSVSNTGAQGNGYSYNAPAVSADGRYVAFVSDAANLVPGDTNGASDVFVRDRRAGTTTRVSVSNTGAQGNRESYPAAVSADGRYVAFNSFATNLVPGDTNDARDVFVRDRRAGTTTRVSVSNTGAQANGYSYEVAVSANGRYVAFDSNATNLVPGDTNDAQDVFVRDRRAGTTTRVSVSNSGAQGNGGSGDPAVSANGRYVAFNSFATNLVPGDTNDARDVFVRDRVD